MIPSKFYGSTKIEHIDTGNYREIVPLLVETNILRSASKYDTASMLNNPI